MKPPVHGESLLWLRLAFGIAHEQWYTSARKPRDSGLICNSPGTRYPACSRSGESLQKQIRPSFSSKYRARGSGPLYLIWQRRDAFSDEEARATPFEMPWKEPTCAIVDAPGAVPPFTVGNGHLSLLLSNTPVFIEATSD